MKRIAVVVAVVVIVVVDGVVVAAVKKTAFSVRMTVFGTKETNFHENSL